MSDTDFLPENGSSPVRGNAVRTQLLVLCQCCAMKLANDDDSSCRNFYNHTHADLSVPAGAVLIDLEPTLNEGVRHLVCDGHGEEIAPLAHYWIAEVLSDPTAL